MEKEISKCGQDADLFYKMTSEEQKILNFNCKIRTRKRQKYYKFDYDPTSIYQLAEKTYGKEIMDEMFYMFDFEKRTKCCYCIAITVYFTQKDKEYFEVETMTTGGYVMKQDVFNDLNKYEYRYLISILQTVQNAKMLLPEWLVRIYMDKSVYQVVKNKNNKTICKLFDEIFCSENVEIYTYECNVKNIEQTRTYRFLPMIDPEVAKLAVREADGYLCKMDCNNIDVFGKTNAILYLAEYFTNSKSLIDDENDLVIESAYDINNDWIVLYKDAMGKYFANRTNLYSLVAGTITLNVQIKKDIFEKTFQNVLSLIDDIQITEEVETEALEIGFDEIFLLDLLKDFISIGRSFDQKEYMMLSQFVIGQMNYPTYRVKGKTIEECVINLPKLVQEGRIEDVPFVDANENNIDFLKIVDSTVSMDSGKIFNIEFPELYIENPFGSELKANLLALLNFQYVYVENKINCVAYDGQLNYRTMSSPKSECWNSVINYVKDFSLFDLVYEEEKKHLDNYYQKKKIEKRKRST